MSKKGIVTEEMRTEEQKKLSDMQMRQKRAAAKRSANRRKRKNRVYLMRLLVFVLGAFGISIVYILAQAVREASKQDKSVETVLEEKVEDLLEKEPKMKWVTLKPEMTELFLTPNEYSRPGETLPEVKSIFVHYTANAGTDARQNRNYFEGLAESGETSASAHFIIGYEGEIVQCLPLDEIGYAVKGRNYDSVSIECCYLEQSGKFTEATYQSLIELVAWLMGEYDLHEEDVLRHYDEGGKNCPKYYVENENKWRVLVRAIESYRKRNGVEVLREESKEEQDGTVDSNDEKE